MLLLVFGCVSGDVALTAVTRCCVWCVLCCVWYGVVLSGVSEVQVYYRDDGRIMLKGEGAREEKALPPT